MGFRGAGLGVLDRGSQPAGAFKVRFREALDHGERKGLARQEVHGKHSTSSATSTTAGKRDFNGLRPVQRDGLPAQPRVGELHGERLTPQARLFLQKSLHSPGVCEVDVREELVKLDWKHIRQCARRLRVA